ncbi:MAG: PAS domain-containing protein [Bacteroidales bacterium]|nr:PAS domain-containing protein [Bacteroidales bacterium]MBN2764647.1 PAS domain-containing protein [Bacteroidales bacterium]
MNIIRAGSDIKGLYTFLMIVFFLLANAGESVASVDGMYFTGQDTLSEMSFEVQLSDSNVSMDEMTEEDDMFAGEDAGFVEDTPVTVERIDNLSESTDAVSDSVVVTASVTELKQNFPFYRRWWFSLLVVLLVMPFVYRFMVNRTRIQSRVIEEHVSKIDEYKHLLSQKEEQLARQESEFREKMIEEEKLKYAAVGLSKFSDILSGSEEELEKVGQNLICELVKYLDVNMGALYIIKGEDSSDKVLELASAYAPGKEQMQAKIHPGEGFVGTCYNEGQLIEITDIPDTYTKISSGLGEALPNYLAFIPLILDEDKLGVIELAAFKNLEKYKLDFVQRLSQNVASFIAIRSATSMMQEMLARSQSQAEELQSQEEELRQNLEEMQATQEELNRQMKQNKIIQDDLAKEKSLMDALMNNIPEYIYFKDLDSKFLKSSRSLAQSFGVSKPEEMIGNSDFDYFEEEHARPAYEGEQEIIRTGKPIIDLVEKEVKKDGRVTWVMTTKMPLYDQNGKIVGTYGISKDITQAKKMEIEVQEKNEALKAQEEELRQNLEEMKTVQEEMERQKAELDWEKHLMDTLLNNLPEYIYFKDKESKFLKNSLSHAKLFGFSDPIEILGKSDFDFFAEEHARPAFEDEQKIIKTGKPIINLVEKEVKKDGSLTWVSTSKMPLHDKNGKIIGTFGISKDITETKKMEMEIQQRNQELQAQEEELRQNLEEMQTIQEDLQKRIKENERIKEEYLKKEAALLKKIDELKKK